MCGEAGTCIVFGAGPPTVASFKPLLYRVYYDTAAAFKSYVGTGTAWQATAANAPAGSGDVTGPAGATDSDFAQYDGITGKLIKDAGFKPSSFDVAGAAAAAQAAAIAASDPAGSAAAALVAAEAYTDAHAGATAVNGLTDGAADYPNENIFVGDVAKAALAATTLGGGQFNTGFGADVLGTNAAGDNSAFGADALAAATTGGENSAFGSSALASNTTGASNIGIGVLAGNSITTGQLNIAIGNQAGAAIASNALNTISIGAGANALADNTAQIGSGGVTALYVGTSRAVLSKASLVSGGVERSVLLTADFALTAGAITINDGTAVVIPAFAGLLTTDAVSVQCLDAPPAGMIIANVRVSAADTLEIFFSTSKVGLVLGALNFRLTVIR